MLERIFPYISPDKIRKNAKFCKRMNSGLMVSELDSAPWQSERPSLHCEVFASTVMVTSNLGRGAEESRAGVRGRGTRLAQLVKFVYISLPFLAAKHVFLMGTSCSVVRGT